MARIIRGVAWDPAMRYRAEVPGAPLGPSVDREREGEEGERDEAIRWARMGRGEKGRGVRWREREGERDGPGDNYCRQREILFSMPGTARMHE